MSLIKITCPHCSFSREIDETAIPVGATAGTCPKCRQRFTIGEAVAVANQPETKTNPSISSPITTRPEPFETGFKNVQTHRQTIRFVFSGKAGEYFGIWIVNTLLKIVTLGAYSAWAKVRKRLYFYGTTRMGTSAFEYLADPKILFRGWLIAAAFFLFYSICSKATPQLGSLLGILFFLVVPWLIVRSRSFNLRNSDHRNIRFTFNPDYREAYLVFAGLPILLPFTLGLIFPYMIYRQKKFFVENSGYGRTRFSFDASAKEFYLLFLKAFGWFILMVMAIVLFVGIFSAAVEEFLPLFRDIGEIGTNSSPRVIATVLLITFFSFNLLYLYFAIYIRTHLANLTWNATLIRKSRFVSTLRVRDMAWLYLSSAIAILFSFGLLVPWASIRITHYKMEHLALDLCDDPETFLGWGHPGIGPVGEEIGDMFGIDIGL